MKDCTIYKTVDIIGKKWTLCILHELYTGDKREKRFNELKKMINGITPKVLSTRLQELEDQGLVKKVIDDSVIPVKCEYSLTEGGEEFINIMQDIKRWGLKHKFENPVCGMSSCKECKL